MSYIWKRFWCPRTGNLALDEGYLLDPEAKWGEVYNPDVKSFDTIGQTPCLVLLGEPGIGKSTAMREAFERVSAAATGAETKSLWFDLRAYGSEDRLVQDLFGSALFTGWATGSHRLQVFIDSLDECLLRIDNVGTLLGDELKEQPIQRLGLRIACRTAEWPSSLEQALTSLWGKENVGVYELAPLRRVDVEEAAKAEGLASEEFLKEIDHLGVVPFATNPVTLNLLINSYRATGKLPTTRSNLYSQGCRLLCEETSERRRDAKLAGRLSADDRLMVASRIAAVNIFSNRSAVWTGLDLGQVPETDVTVRSLAGGRESTDSLDIEITEAAIRETLGTGLFSSRGAYRMGWAHQTYAEFLAAKYLAERRVPWQQIKSLIVNPEDPEQRVVPQLHEAVAWLAVMDRSVFQYVVETDPDVLLRSDVAGLDDADRKILLQNLLHLLEQERIHEGALLAYKRGGRLNHPDIVGQLQPYLCDSKKAISVRRAAIQIARDCEVRELQTDLAAIGLDSREPHPVRVAAVLALDEADADTKKQLLPLAITKSRDDSDDELKGSALQVLWPEHITAEQLFPALTPPKRSRLIGIYRMFLGYRVIPRLRPEDLPTALRWAEKIVRKYGRMNPFERLVDQLLWKAWQQIELPGVLESLAPVALSRLEAHDEIVDTHEYPNFRNELMANDERRRFLLEGMLGRISSPEKDAIWLVLSHTPVAVSRDVPWMINLLARIRSQKRKKALVQLIRRAFDWRDETRAELVFHASQQSPLLAQAFTWLLEPVNLNSPEAEKMKNDYGESKKWEERAQRQKALLKPPPAERIAALLDKFESGEADAWWQLAPEMTLEPHSTHYGSELEPDLRTLPGWQAADEATRARLVAAAKKYLLERDAAMDKWLGTNILYRPAFAGYKAFHLLYEEAPEFVSSLPASVWKKWASIILGYPTSGEAEEKVQKELLSLAYNAAPDEVLDALLVLIDKENAETDHIYVTQKLENSWDERLAKVLAARILDPSLKPECMGYLLAHLLAHGVAEARSFAATLLPSPLPSRDQDRNRARIAAETLLGNASDAGWDIVWRAITCDPEFGREVMLNFAYRSFDRHTGGFAARLSEEQAADLYIWLARQFPYGEDPKYEGAHTVGARESVARLRDSVLRRLQERGTYKACDEIGRIAKELPHLRWLKWTLREAQAIARRRTWAPPEPEDILKLLDEPSKRLVQDGSQLLDILTESLRRLEAELQGETPASIFLWNEVSMDTFRPRKENDFADYVKLHFHRDLVRSGIVVNREVEIRRGQGADGEGERTDVHVDAIRVGARGEASDVVTVVVEVKGCWHPQLRRAMETQLIARYLKDNQCQYGVYLVGWFVCDQWDATDRRRNRVPKWSLAEARAEFDGQAQKLSQGEMRIRAVVLNTALR